MWLRVASLAYGKHRANGHANFRPGEVAVILSSIDTTTGEITKPSRQSVGRAIRVAVEYGWLAAGSSSCCLVVPGHAVQGGLGSPHETCKVHNRKRQMSSLGDDEAA